MPRRRDNRERSIQDEVIANVVDVMAQAGVNTLFTPVNFGMQHWAGMMFDLAEKMIKYYDSLNEEV